MLDRDILKPRGDCWLNCLKIGGKTQIRSGGLYNTPGPDASRTGPNPPDAAILTDMTYLLEVGIPDALAFIVRMADIVTDMRCLAAEFTYSAHESSFLSHKGRGNPFSIDQNPKNSRMPLE